MISMEMTDIREMAELADMLPQQCILDCTEGGSNYEACCEWVERLGIDIPRGVAVGMLREYGTWTDEELWAMGRSELNVSAIWIASGYAEDMGYTAELDFKTYDWQCR
jgi:hypothetical protein